eukprot:CAMPEP_0184524748 /NCGR_PEP_ID=MMETSP0198_2-20121128/9704_1 /TAXON_ID=1112570 /ORGANISM="Thraustochytrium sp., Strain LLF1b" /LENGTH=49 /DNA_ID=CAMNT_0026916109 /DNA_START=18 /DNA_END=167 /DNA_ORIENTATION=-
MKPSSDGVSSSPFISKVGLKARSAGESENRQGTQWLAALFAAPRFATLS